VVVAGKWWLTLVARAQGGLTLGRERGELGADFGRFGGKFGCGDLAAKTSVSRYFRATLIAAVISLVACTPKTKALLLLKL
jgi:hypothetical protein